jgi:hypothetical protein
MCWCTLLVDVHFTAVSGNVANSAWVPLMVYIVLTNSMEQSPSWEANRSSASQEIPPRFMEPEGSLPHSQQPATCTYPEPYQRISPGPRLCIVFRNMVIFLRWGVVSTSPNPEAGGPPLVCCPRLHIRSYPPYLQAVPPSATRGRAMPWWQGPTYRGDRDRLIVVTGTDLSWVFNYIFTILSQCLIKHLTAKTYGRVKVLLHEFLIWALHDGEWLASRSGRFASGPVVVMERETGWYQRRSG